MSIRFPEPREVPRTKKSLFLPHNPWWEVQCPSCRSLTTEYHPAENWGRCHDCGQQWFLIHMNDDRVDPSVLLDRLDPKTRGMVEHICLAHQPTFRQRVAVMLQQGSNISYDELKSWDDMIHNGYRTPDVRRG